MREKVTTLVWVLPLTGLVVDTKFFRQSGKSQQIKHEFIFGACFRGNTFNRSTCLLFAFQVSVSDNLYTFMHQLWLNHAPIGELFQSITKTRFPKVQLPVQGSAGRTRQYVIVILNSNWSILHGQPKMCTSMFLYCSLLSFTKRK